MISQISKPRTRDYGLKTGKWKRNTGLKIATWNVTSLFRTGACQNLADVMNTYKIDVAAIQEVRWLDVGQINVGEYVIYYSGSQSSHHFGSGFAVHRKLVPHVIEFRPISDKLSLLMIDTKPINICIVKAHAPTEVSSQNKKDEFYDELTKIYEGIRKNSIKIAVGDMNAKCGRESQFIPTIGRESLHEQCNDNGLRLVSFATSAGMTISSTTFPHKDIHKATWKSPDDKTRNQIDHILIERRFKSSITDVRNYRGADCDTDHFLVIAKFKTKLKSPEKIKTEKKSRINIEMLKDPEVKRQYQIEMDKIVEELTVKNEELDWEAIRKMIVRIAEQNIGVLRRSNNVWYNNKCQKAIEQRKKAREDHLRWRTDESKRIFISERKVCKKILQQEKRKFFNNILQTAEEDRSQNKIRNFFHTIKQYKQFNPICKAIKRHDGQIIMDADARASRWKEYFENLLNATIPDNPTPYITLQGVEPLTENISQEEVNVAVAGLKNWKAPGSDNIPAELLKYGGNNLQKVLFRVCDKIWKEEQMPTSWHEAVIMPLHKKEDKMECDNYRGISLLNTAYKIFSKILLKRLLETRRCFVPNPIQLGARKSVRELQCLRSSQVTNNENGLRILGFADDLDIIGNSLTEIANASRELEKSAEKVGLTINTNKTKLMELIDSDIDPQQREGLSFEKVEEFKYLGATLSIKNDWSKEINIRINKAEKTFYALLKFLNSKTLSRRSKTRLYGSIIRPSLTYGCETWTTTVTTERRLRTFENRIWRKICGPVFDTNVRCWRRRFNRELQEIMNLTPVTSFIKGQRIQWLGHILRREENDPVRDAFEWKPMGIRPRGRPKKRWIDGVAEDLKEMGIEDWRVIAQDRKVAGYCSDG
ncbi:hypothetical protein QTP88_025183 [Uroleucon formosanum]